MLRNGAVGYLGKSSLAEDLAETIRATYQGKMVYSGFSTNTIANCIIRVMPIRNSGTCRSPIPLDADQRFRPCRSRIPGLPIKSSEPK
jgi:hypothetical protein